MRHERRGFQRTFTNDVYHIEARLQEYDEHLYVMYNPRTGEHLIMDGLVDIAVMRIPQAGFPVLAGNVVEHMKRIHTANGFNAVADVEAADAARERESDRVLDDLAADFAKESKEAFTAAYDYGITSGRKKYVSGW